MLPMVKPKISGDPDFGYQIPESKNENNPTSFKTTDLYDITNLPEEQYVVSIIIWLNDIKRDNEYRISFTNRGYKTTEEDKVFHCAYEGTKYFMAKVLYTILTSDLIDEESLEIIGRAFGLNANIIRSAIYAEFYQTQIQITTVFEDYNQILTIKHH